jgi:histidinol-phosphate aminotransferase
VGVALNEGDFSLDLETMLQAIEQHNPAVIFLAYPNNPTGNLFDKQDIETIITATNGLVIIDEAYYSFAETTWINEFQRFDNVLVMRTLSKIGLAGLRIGMLVGANDWLAEFDKIRLPYNINALSQASATFMLKHIGVFDRQAAKIRADRQMMFEALNRFSRLTVWPSRANFLLIKSEHSQTIFDKLKEQKILIKNLGGAHSMLEDCLRITIGSEHENQAILTGLGSIEKQIP